MEFDFEKEITNFWTAKILSHEGNHYLIRNAEWNSVIKPHETIRLGFLGKPGKVTREPENYQLTTMQDDDAATEETPPDDEMGLIDLDKVDWDKDTDGDGIPDEIEEYLGLDPNNKDTDQDGLDDRYEMEMTETNPHKKDSDGNGISDDQEDLDQDGLNNQEEFKIRRNLIWQTPIRMA